MEKYTENDLVYISDLGKRICQNFKLCVYGCPFCVTDNNNLTCTLKSIKGYLEKEKVITNAEKFKKVFGFSVHDGRWNLTQDVEDWLKDEYKGP